MKVIKRLCCSSSWFSQCLLPIGWILTVPSPVDALHNHHAIFTSKENISIVLQGPKWHFGSADSSFNMSALKRSLTTSFFCTVSSLLVVHTISNAFSASCLTPFCELFSASLLPCITKRKKSLAMCDFVCVCVIILLLCSCVVLRWCQLNI